MRFFLAGGAGFIGTHLTRLLVEHGHRVTVFDNLSTGTMPEVLDHSVDFIKGDIAYAHSYPDMKDCDVVVNLACVDMSDAVADPRRALAVNVTGTLNLLEASKRLCRRFVQISSCSVYGEQKPGPIPEDAPLLPFTPYAAHKLAGEALVRAYHTHGWVDGTIVRPSNVYGPGQMPPKHKGVVGLFIKRKIEGKKADLYGDFRRDFTYVTDVAEGIYLTATRGDLGPYNIAWGVGTPISTIALLVGVETRAAEPRSIDLVTSRTLDIIKAQKELGYDPKTPLSVGIPKQEAWMREAVFPCA